MQSTFAGIEMSKKTLFVQQAALSTTGHNISNANTDGYSRQIVGMVATKPLSPGGMTRGVSTAALEQGVEFDGVNRAREKFLDDQFHNENKLLGEWNMRQDSLDKIESIINEPSDTGVRQVLENFWNSWQDLSKEPDNLTARAVVKERTMSMVDALNYNSKQLKDLSTDLTNNIDVKLREANTYTQQIAELNDAIFRIKALGDDTNDLRDQRDLLTDKLSKILNITVQEEEKGFNIKMGSVELVKGKVQSNVIRTEDLKPLVNSKDLSSGELYGMLFARDSIVTNYQDQLNALAKTMATGKIKVTLPAGTVLPEGTVINGETYTGTDFERTLGSAKDIEVDGINGLHRLGYSMTKTLNSGEDFFTTKDGTNNFTADNITLNPKLFDDVRYIAASLRSYSDNGTPKVVSGNGDMALALADFRNKTFNFDPDQTNAAILTDGTFEEFYRSAIGAIGVQSQEAQRQQTNQKILVEQVDSRRQSVSGVSIDEEMANMMKYQHAYNAAARTMNTFDDMLDRIINKLGRVGQ